MGRHGKHGIAIAQTPSKSCSVLEGRDDGEPIDDDRRELIFELSRRAHELRGLAGSVGLGLSMARTLAERTDGELVSEHGGRESIFRVSLPAARAARAACPYLGAIRIPPSIRIDSPFM